jgi:outer membrane biosynthesis protein TonB
VRLNAEGTTVVGFLVEPDGSVRNAVLLQSAGSQRETTGHAALLGAAYTALDDMAVACMKFWHIEPVMKDGKPIEATKTFSVQWRMQGPPK